MSTEAGPSNVQTIEVGAVAVELVRKDIKNVHLSVYPPDGRVRMAVPLHVDEEAARLRVIDRLDWIRRRQKELSGQRRQSRREMATGESHYVWGQRYRLNVIRHSGPNRVRLQGASRLDLELAKKPPQCTEYIVVHEMVHLLEATHNDRFKSLMDRCMPQWRRYRATLNQAPLAHEEWDY